MHEPTREEFIQLLQDDDDYYRWVRTHLNLKMYRPPLSEPEENLPKEPSELRARFSYRNDPLQLEFWDELEARGVRTQEDFAMLAKAELLTFRSKFWYMGMLLAHLETKYHPVSKPQWEEKGTPISSLGQNGKGHNPWKYILKWGITHLGQLEHLRADDLLKIEGIGPAGVILVRKRMAEEGFHFSDERPSE